MAGRIVRHAGEAVLKLMMDLKELELFKGICAQMDEIEPDEVHR